jgi:hypothetical protein
MIESCAPSSGLSLDAFVMPVLMDEGRQILHLSNPILASHGNTSVCIQGALPWLQTTDPFNKPTGYEQNQSHTAANCLHVMCRPVDYFKSLSLSKHHPEVNADGPLCVLHGTDSFQSIGMPDGRPVLDSTSAVTAWRAELLKVFPEQAQPGSSVISPPDLTTFPGDQSTLLKTLDW